MESSEVGGATTTDSGGQARHALEIERVWKQASDGHLGVFSRLKIERGEVVERCYCLPVSSSDLHSDLLPWLYNPQIDLTTGKSDEILFAFGWGMLYNEPAGRDTSANLVWEHEVDFDEDKQERHWIVFRTCTVVAQDEELCVLRRPEHWSGIRDLCGSCFKNLYAAGFALPEKADHVGADSEIDVHSALQTRKDVGVEVRCSEKHGYGVYAKRSFNKGEVIEIVPNMFIDRSFLGQALVDYRYFAADPDNGVAKVGLGYASIYNHADDPNVKYRSARVQKVEGPLRFTTCYYASRDIDVNEELCISYGPKWWAARKNPRHLEYHDGSHYEGETANRRRHGQGTYYYANGDSYTGQWKDNAMHGEGKYTWTEGQVFEGAYDAGCRHGRGTCTAVDGSKEIDFYEHGTATVGVSLSSCGTKAWRRNAGKITEQIDLTEVDVILGAK